MIHLSPADRQTLIDSLFKSVIAAAEARDIVSMVQFATLASKITAEEMRLPEAAKGKEVAVSFETEQK